jgi:predicted AlkP superfamily phosphohydrolase/phosphomutase
MPKVVIIGIDGFDPLVLDRFRDSLLNLKRLYDDVSEITIESTFPPDSICAWASIYTGENPAEHGLVESIDYLSGKRADDKDRSSYLQGRTFWDIAGRKDRKVCIINPFIAYPAWEVNGIMISGPVFEGGETTAYPRDILKRYTLPPLGGMVDFPRRDELKDFVKRTEKITRWLGEVGLKIYLDEKPDLFFLTFLTLDRIKHFLWRYTDEDDRYYPGENEFKDVIKRFYILFDRIIGEFINNLYDDSILLVISDHGHRRRCTKSLNLNEILRKKGYINTAGGIKGIIERTKVLTIRTLSRYNLEDWIYRIARLMPHRKALKRSTYLIDTERSTVSLANLCGANPYGGIDISIDGYGELERLKKEIITTLYQINNEYGQRIIKWARLREEVYSGRNEDKLPDVLFELDEDYGVGRDFYTKPITENYTHKKISGGHKREAVFMVVNRSKDFNFVDIPLNILSIRDYILKILHIGDD